MKSKCLVFALAPLRNGKFKISFGWPEMVKRSERKNQLVSRISAAAFLFKFLSVFP